MNACARVWLLTLRHSKHTDHAPERHAYHKDNNSRNVLQVYSTLPWVRGSDGSTYTRRGVALSIGDRLALNTTTDVQTE